MAVVGDIVMLKVDTGRDVPAIVTLVNSGDNINVVAFSDTSADWPNGSPTTAHPAQLWSAVDKGTAVGEWQDI